MRASRALGTLAGAAAVALATLLVAAPASAATLADGQKITVVEFLDTNDPAEGQFYDVNPADAASTPVGTATGAVIIGLEVNDDGIGAAIGQLDNQSTIWTADANSGTISNPHTIALNGQIELNLCSGIDLVNNTFIISCLQSGDSPISHVGSVDPATGAFTPFLSLSGDDYLEFDALANDTNTAQLWGFAWIGGDSHSYTIDLENDVVDEVATMDRRVHAADFDRDGQLFVSTEDPFESQNPGLAVADPFTGAYSFFEVYISTATDADLAFVAALTIWGAPAPALAPTGAEVAPIAIGSVLLLLAGAAFIATARVDRRRSA